MSSILSAQNLQTFRRRKKPPPRRLSPPLASLASLPRAPPGPPRLGPPNAMLSLHLPAVEHHVAGIVVVFALRSFTRLTVGGQATRHAAAARLFGALGAHALGLDRRLVDADDQVAQQPFGHLEAA